MLETKIIVHIGSSLGKTLESLGTLVEFGSEDTLVSMWEPSWGESEVEDQCKTFVGLGLAVVINVQNYLIESGDVPNLEKGRIILVSSDVG